MPDSVILSIPPSFVVPSIRVIKTSVHNFGNTVLFLKNIPSEDVQIVCTSENIGAIQAIILRSSHRLVQKIALVLQPGCRSVQIMLHHIKFNLYKSRLFNN